MLSTFRICATLLLTTVLLASCGGGGGGDVGGDQSALTVCSNFQVLLPDGTCGVPPEVTCELPEVLVDGQCIIPDDPDPKFFPGPDEAVVYYNRRDKNFDGWVLHLWNSG